MARGERREVIGFRHFQKRLLARLLTLQMKRGIYRCTDEFVEELNVDLLKVLQEAENRGVNVLFDNGVRINDWLRKLLQFGIFQESLKLS